MKYLTSKQSGMQMSHDFEKPCKLQNRARQILDDYYSFSAFLFYIDNIILQNSLFEQNKTQKRICVVVFTTYKII
jgi:hypothetical protein